MFSPSNLNYSDLLVFSPQSIIQATVLRTLIAQNFLKNGVGIFLLSLVEIRVYYSHFFLAKLVDNIVNFYSWRLCSLFSLKTLRIFYEDKKVLPGSAVQESNIVNVSLFHIASVLHVHRTSTVFSRTYDAPGQMQDAHMLSNKIFRKK